jgi:membrane protease YdiL (CAAX protease family)
MQNKINPWREENIEEKNPLTLLRYLIGVVIIFLCIYSQYLLQGVDIRIEIVIVYGIPLILISYLWGEPILRKAFHKTRSVVWIGLGFFGLFMVIGTILAIAIYYLLTLLDPSALNLLHKPNPVLNIPPELAWAMIWVSFFIVGPIEEYLFRGFIFGGLITLFKDKHWFTLAFFSSLLFAAAHLYYASVYGIASAVQFTDIICFGLAMATTYYFSGGNLIVPAVMHGAYDATGFLGIATSSDIGVYLRVLMMVSGVVIAIIFFTRKTLFIRSQPIP